MPQHASGIDATAMMLQSATTPFPAVASSSCSEPSSPNTSAADDPAAAAAAALAAGAAEPPSAQDSQLTLRALVSTKEAGVIIGKGGRNVADLREAANVKAGVSKVVPGVHDRVLSVTGLLADVAHAYQLVAQTLVDNPLTAPGAANPALPAAPGLLPPPPQMQPHQLLLPPQQTIVRILIAHNLMGTIIGRQGLKIKHIQDASGARLVATKEMLPQSTERVVEIHGSVDGIRIAVEEIGKCLIEDWARGMGAILYNPATRVPTVSSSSNPYVNSSTAAAATGSLRAPSDFAHPHAAAAADIDRPAPPLPPVAAAAPPSSGAMAAAMAAMSRQRSHTVSVTRPSAPADHHLLASSIPMPPLPPPANGGSAAAAAAIAFPASSGDGPAAPLHYASPSPSPAPAAHLAAVAAGARLRSQSVSIQPQRAAILDPAAIMANIRTQQITIPCDMVGCIIGKNGARISEIRRLSGSRISIAKASESEGGERLFTIRGTAECNERALYLLYGQLEAERERRIANAQLMTSLEAINEHFIVEH
ncbi:RNA binding protein, heterogenous nuclear RNP-K like protein [Coemansia javaensis]|uniref:RNA binding protein, heterogenous nuclear RNP-K like protein n=1 Tax=Coemansia javaensis TaxID=2761396 RepID=A0A9W8LG87_9FUNG|nr:RNA binding protein, heterogenous nuclear RNP-K like protein [Coemansia javaensis]